MLPCYLGFWASGEGWNTCDWCIKRGNQASYSGLQTFLRLTLPLPLWWWGQLWTAPQSLFILLHSSSRRHWVLGISSGHWAMREVGCVGYTEETNLIPSSHGHCIRAPLEPEAGKWYIIFESRSSVGPVGWIVVDAVCIDEHRSHNTTMMKCVTPTVE